MRRFVYTQCKRVVDEGYAKYHTSRKNHEYDKATPEEIAQDFASLKPYLTFFDTTAVEQRQQSLEKEQVKTTWADVVRLEAQIAELRAASIRNHENKEILDNEAPPPASR
jgi:hypothetical protein